MGAKSFFYYFNMKSINRIRLLWLQAELWYQLLADTTEKKRKEKRHNFYTTQIQGKCLQEVEQPMTEPALQYEPKKRSIFVHKAAYRAF